MPPSPRPQISAADPDQVRAAVARISADAAGEPGVDVLETHISYVFLTPSRAYKLKKPLILPFLDYGTPQRRRALCSEEIRLNQRLAGDLYIGVLALIQRPDGLELADEDQPDAIDYVVEMRRYDERQTLAATLERGELTDGEIRELARELAGFHARCPPGDDSLRHDAQAVGRAGRRNVDELLGMAGSRAQRQRIRALDRTMSALVGAREAMFDARCADGRTRECHGDLRAEHVVLGSPVRVVDCVEFDLGLRTLDVADDLAFLVMDLTRLGGERYARELITAYRQAGGDCGDDKLLAFFAVHRALVRAKVMLVRAGQQPPESPAREQARTEAQNLLALGERLAWRTRLPPWRSWAGCARTVCVRIWPASVPGSAGRPSTTARCSTGPPTPSSGAWPPTRSPAAAPRSSMRRFATAPTAMRSGHRLPERRHCCSCNACARSASWRTAPPRASAIAPASRMHRRRW